MKTYSQIKEIIRDVCSPFSVSRKEEATAELKEILDFQLLDVRNMDESMWYAIQFSGGEESEGTWVSFNFITKAFDDDPFYMKGKD